MDLILFFFLFKRVGEGIEIFYVWSEIFFYLVNNRYMQILLSTFSLLSNYFRYLNVAFNTNEVENPADRNKRERFS